MAKTEITENELILALRQALIDKLDEDGTLTSTELSDQLKMSAQSILIRLRQLKKQGLLEVVRTRREDIAGRVQRVIGYRLKNEE